MASGKLYTAEVICQHGRIRATCRCCHADLDGAEVLRAEEANNRTVYVVACPNCGRYITYYRKVQEAVA